MSPEKRSGPSLFGQVLRQWRRARGLSQLELALRASVPQRHLSFLETGRARPGEEMVLRLAKALDVPLRERNEWLAAAGFVGRYLERPVGEASEFYRTAVRALLDGHLPYPAHVLDGRWNLVEANAAARRLSPALDVGESFALALFAPGPFRDSIENWEAVSRVAFARLARDAREHPSSEQLAALVDRAHEHLRDADVAPFAEANAHGVDTSVICPRIRVGDRIVSTFSMLASFTSAHALSLDELRVELLFPADEESAIVLRAL